MDQWQKELYDRLKDFAGGTARLDSTIGPVEIGITMPEAYVLMKALEAQDKFDNPRWVTDAILAKETKSQG